MSLLPAPGLAQSDPAASVTPVRSRFHFKTGVPAGETVAITDDAGEIVARYRSFASPIGIVSAVVSGIIFAAGIAGATFLVLEHDRLMAGGALLLSGFFAVLIAMLVPAVKVTLIRDAKPWLTIEQRSRSAFPRIVFGVVTREGETAGVLRKSIWSRLWRNRWSIADAGGDEIGQAFEESLARAVARKFAGKFSRKFEADVIVRIHGTEVARIHRRTKRGRPLDVLDVQGGTVDPRVAVALATLILGSEP